MECGFVVLHSSIIGTSRIQNDALMQQVARLLAWVLLQVNTSSLAQSIVTLFEKSRNALFVLPVPQTRPTRGIVNVSVLAILEQLTAALPIPCEVTRDHPVTLLIHNPVVPSSSPSFLLARLIAIPTSRSSNLISSSLAPNVSSFFFASRTSAKDTSIGLALLSLSFSMIAFSMLRRCRERDSSCLRSASRCVSGLMGETMSGGGGSDFWAEPGMSSGLLVVTRESFVLAAEVGVSVDGGIGIEAFRGCGTHSSRSRR